MVDGARGFLTWLSLVAIEINQHVQRSATTPPIPEIPCLLVDWNTDFYFAHRFPRVQGCSPEMYLSPEAHLSSRVL